MKKIKNVFYAILPTLIILLFIEFSARIYYCSKNNEWQYILYGLNLTSLEGTVNTRVLKLEESKKNNIYYKDYIEHKSDTNYEHIFCLGASTTVGNDIENNYPRYLNRKLKKKFGENVLVHIVGKGHINSNHFLKMLKEEMKNSHPRLIILYCGYNDFFNNTITVSKSKSKLLKLIIGIEEFSLFTKIAKEKIYVLQKQMEAAKEKKSMHDYSLENFEKNIQKLSDYSFSSGIKLILVPDVLDARKFNGITKTFDDFNKKNNDIKKTLRNISEENKNVFFLDLYHLFDFKNPENNVHIDVAHLTNDGYNILSEGIFNFIIEKNLLQDF